MKKRNYSELRVVSRYSWPEHDPDDRVNTHIYSVVTEDTDQVKNKWLHGVDVMGLIVDLTPYTSVDWYTIENISAQSGFIAHTDTGTGDLVLSLLPPGEHVTYCVPDVATGIFVSAWVPDEEADFHLAFVGRQ